MKTRILIGAGLSACLAAWASKDPVIMTVNGIEVPRSEFEYLYHKNNKQQLVPQTLDDYVSMFEIYKLKVADAKAAGLDTLPSFLQEMAQYRQDLAAPYLTDSVFVRSLAEEYLDRVGEEIEASHIMLLKTRNASENRQLRTKLDSIRKEIIKGADFNEMALTYSKDPSVKSNKGNLGFITAGRYPYSFETAVWNAKPGEVTEVVESPVGYHLIKTGGRRKSRGKVEASHIMSMIRPDASEEMQQAAKQKIDSIYSIVKADASKFSELAKTLSDDKGSARQGGLLPVFGTGEMVPEFEKAAFELADGEISEPVRSMYGWHIILKHRGVPAPELSEAEQMLWRRLSNPQDERAKLMKERQTQKLANKHKGKLNAATLEAVLAAASVNGIDSAFLAATSSGQLSQLPLVEIGKKKYPVKEFMSGAAGMGDIPSSMSELIIRDAAGNFFNSRLREAEEDWLYENDADYRNLLNEYHDGTLLYEISLEKVWNKASEDSEGLNNFFESHRSDYTWTQPRVKGFLVQSVNDSVSQEIRKALAGVPENKIEETIKKEFSGMASVEKILTSKGGNPLVDYLFYQGPSVALPTSKFSSVFLYEPREIPAPEEVDDVKGQVISDYQNQLEKEWVDNLRALYPVKVNNKELKKVK